VTWFPRVFAAVVILVLGWLFFAPPSLTLEGTGDSLSCRALGSGGSEKVTLAKDPSDRAEVITRYLEEPGPGADDSGALSDEEVRAANDETIAEATAEAQALCADARQNRQTTLLLGSAASLALLIWWRTRRFSAPAPAPAPTGSKEI
jgi:hypothetical protein